MITNSLLKLLIACLSATTMMCLAEEPSNLRRTEGVELVENQYIVQYDKLLNFEETKQNILNDNEVQVVRYIDTRNIGVFKFTSKKAATKWRDNAEGVKYFEADSIIRPDSISSSQGSRRLRQGSRKLVETTPYGLTYVKAEAVPDDSAGSRKVCIVSTGYDMGHPDLPFDDTNTLITGESFVEGFDWFTDEMGDGTRDAGIIAALGGNDIGIKGVIRNGNLRLHISKIFSIDDEYYYPPMSRIIAGYQSCVDNGANVINMSYSSYDNSQSLADVIEDAYSAGIITFAGAGRVDYGCYEFPASFPYVVSVSSINESYESSENWNDEVDLCAPGSSMTTIPGGGYISVSSYRVASAYAAGVAALVWSHNPELSHEIFINILETTATDLPLGASDGYDPYFGHGLIDAESAYEAVLASIPPTVSPAPSLSSAPSNTPSVSVAPSSTPTDSCPAGFTLAKVEVITGYYPEDASWEIKDADDIVVASRESFPYWSTLYEDKVCLAETETCSGTDYMFTITHEGFFGSAYSSYRVIVDGETFVEGGPSLGNFGSLSTSLCKNCTYYESEHECTDETTQQGCFWSNIFGCRDCSVLGFESKPRFSRRACNYFDCTWNAGSCE